jgi:enterochelin esterase-like enzyme
VKLKLTMGLLVFAASLFGQSQQPPAAADLETKTFHSSILGREETIHVLLPPGYRDPKNSERSYPTIYLLDGGKMLGTRTGDLNLTDVLVRLIESGRIEPIIVVAVDEYPEDAGRREEYLPYRDPIMAPNAPEPRGKVFPDFLVIELLPYVSKTYRVTGDPRKTAIGGLSYSGIAALYALINKPATFQLALIESPSLQAGNGQLLRDTEHLVLAGKRVAVGVGTMEGGKSVDPSLNKLGVEIVGALVANLKSAYLPPEVRFTVDEGASHEASAWVRRIPDDLIFLFGAPP